MENDRLAKKSSENKWSYENANRYEKQMESEQDRRTTNKTMIDDSPAIIHDNVETCQEEKEMSADALTEARKNLEKERKERKQERKEIEE